MAGVTLKTQKLSPSEQGCLEHSRRAKDQGKMLAECCRQTGLNGQMFYNTGFVKAKVHSGGAIGDSADADPRTKQRIARTLIVEVVINLDDVACQLES